MAFFVLLFEGAKMKKSKVPSLEKIESALLQKALGYDHDEVVEEYVVDEEGEVKLTNKKVTKKHFQPDIPAAKILLEEFNKNVNIYENMSEAQLEKEKNKLIKLLKKEGKNGN